MKFIFIFLISQMPFLSNAEATAANCFETQVSKDNKDNLKAVITDYVCSETNVVIPSKIDGATVVGIGDWAFYSYSYSRRLIESVEIPNSVEEIGQGAFQNNSLTSIVIPKSVKNIQRAAFYGNHLNDVLISESGVNLGECAFGYNDFKSIKVPQNTIVQPKAFFCYNIVNKIEIGSNVDFKYSKYESDHDQQFIDLYNQGRNAGIYAYKGNGWIKLQ